MSLIGVGEPAAGAVTPAAALTPAPATPAPVVGLLPFGAEEPFFAFELVPPATPTSAAPSVWGPSAMSSVTMAGELLPLENTPVMAEAVMTPPSSTTTMAVARVPC